MPVMKYLNLKMHLQNGLNPSIVTFNNPLGSTHNSREYFQGKEEGRTKSSKNERNAQSRKDIQDKCIAKTKFSYS